jgi:hypothetical protein
LPEPCPECQYVGVEKRYTKSRGEYRKCVKCGHEYDVDGGVSAGAGAGAETATT